MTGTDTERGQAGAELGWVCGSDRWTREDGRTDRQAGGQTDRQAGGQTERQTGAVDVRNSPAAGGHEGGC